MKISEFIQKLEDIKDEHGDLVVTIDTQGKLTSDLYLMTREDVFVYRYDTDKDDYNKSYEMVLEIF